MMADEFAEAGADAAFTELAASVDDSIKAIAGGQAHDLKASQATIRNKLTNMRACIRQFEEFAEEQDSEEESGRLLMKVSKQRRQYEALQNELRKALQQRQREAEETAVRERKALMGSPEARQRQMQMRSEADLAGTAEGITASLQRTRQQMAQELEHTAATLAAMDVSDEVLKDARTEFQGQKTSHKRSHQLLGTMRRHSVLDFLTLWGGLSIFMLVVVYIVAKRSFYFVPNFARNLAMMPFRPRNHTIGHHEDVLISNGGAPGTLDAEELSSFDEEWSAAQKRKGGDLSVSADAEAGLQEEDLRLRKATAQMEEAYREADAQSERQTAEAYPGSQEIPMKANVETSEVNLNASNDLPDNGSAPSPSIAASIDARAVADTTDQNVDDHAFGQEALLGESEGAGDQTGPANISGEDDELAKEDSVPMDEKKVAPSGTDSASDGVSVDADSTTLEADDIAQESKQEHAAIAPAPSQAQPASRDALEETSKPGRAESNARQSPSGQVKWSDDDTEVYEPVSETSTALNASSWDNKQRGLEDEEKTTRQEDTELGIFRPDEL